MTGPIRIGIIGGGIAGVAAAIALVKHPHVNVQVYEGASQFTERGAGVGLSPLALEALEDIIPSATDLLKTQAGAVGLDAARLVLVCGVSGPNTMPYCADTNRARDRRQVPSSLILELAPVSL